MSFVKRAYFPGERQGELLVREIVPGESTKVASALCPGAQDFIATLKPDPRYTYVLTNAMGFSQYYGANSNKDWYGYNEHLNFDGLLNSWSDIGENLEADRMKGKGWSYGYPCFYGATVYAHHKNTDPQRLGFGDVIFAGINPYMKRVELVQRVFNEEAAKKGHTSILQRIRAGERVDVSMGCKVPFDFCSICTDWDAVRTAWKSFNPKLHKHPGIAILAYHKKVKPIRGLAITKVDYCQHMLTMGGKILPNGQKVFVYNDFPRFFDISFVWIGADRTARVMWHLSEGALPRSTVPDASRGSLEALLRRLLVSRGKVAMMEKEIPNGIAQAVHADAARMPSLDSTTIRVVSGDPRKALSTLASLGILLKPGEFAEMVLGHGLGSEKVSFDLTKEGVDDTYAVSPDLVDVKLANAFAPMMASRSGFAPFLNERLLQGGKVASRPVPKVISHPVMDKIAQQYNGYRLSVMEKSATIFGKPIPWLEKEVPQLKLGPALPAPLDPPGPGLLLGPGAMVHFTASHMPRAEVAGTPINTVAHYATAENSFNRLVTIGVALRAAMEVGKAGGLLQAAKKVVNFVTKIL